jgi:signal transduction histidine kinase
VLKKLSSHIFTGSEVLANRLEELLELARYSRGAFKLNLLPTNIPNFIEEVAARFKPTLDKNGQHLNLRIAQGLQDYILDSSRIEQVMVNLLSNASKYSPPRTLVSLSVKGADNGLWVEVQDEGKGISKEDQDTLFQPYHRLKSVSGDTPGLGLGLSICKQIIEAHGGKIWVSSVPAKGSTFGFWVPAKTGLGEALYIENQILKD